IQWTIALLVTSLIIYIPAECESICKVRILLQQDGRCDISKDIINVPMEINEITLAPQCVNNKNIYLYHKTSNREHFPQLTIGKEYINFNQHNEITEFVNGNLVLLINNQWVTPKIKSGLLAGTMRQFYLDQKQIIEKTILIDELLKADKIAFINSVRKWVEIDDKVFDRFKQML
ncbi:Branched-chain amino acid aminotransferase/4-amino-4-deoxychorismate lyase, partial [Gilliamella apicola SCGC AB-598-B02]